MKTNKKTNQKPLSPFEKAIGYIAITVIAVIMLATGVIGWHAMRYTRNNETQPQCQSCEATLETKDAYCFRCGSAVETRQ